MNFRNFLQNFIFQKEIKAGKIVKNEVYISTHRFLTSSIPDIPRNEIDFYLKKSHPIRKIQDQFCYIHSKIDGNKIFSPTQHLILEKAIVNNLKFFTLEYLPPVLSFNITACMQSEAIEQRKCLSYMKPSNIIFHRLVEINYFLSYAYSRSRDYFYDNIFEKGSQNK